MVNGGNLVKHMNEFNGLLDQLKKDNVKIEEENKVLMLLSSLPNSYKNFVNSLIIGKDTLTMELGVLLNSKER